MELEGESSGKDVLTRGGKARVECDFKLFFKTGRETVRRKVREHFQLLPSEKKKKKTNTMCVSFLILKFMIFWTN